MATPIDTTLVAEGTTATITLSEATQEGDLIVFAGCDRGGAASSSVGAFTEDSDASDYTQQSDGTYRRSLVLGYLIETSGGVGRTSFSYANNVASTAKIIAHHWRPGSGETFVYKGAGKANNGATADTTSIDCDTPSLSFGNALVFGAGFHKNKSGGPADSFSTTPTPDYETESFGAANGRALAAISYLTSTDGVLNLDTGWTNNGQGNNGINVAQMVFEIVSGGGGGSVAAQVFKILSNRRAN